MKTFSRETREAMLEAYNGYSVLSFDKAIEFHHRVPNTKPNQRRFPNFLQSVFNCAPLSRRDHIERKHELDIPIKVADAYEETLRKLSGGAQMKKGEKKK